MSKYTKPTLSTFLLFLFLGLPLICSAQDTLRYEGDYQLGPYLGKAIFSYSLSGNDTIIDGPFRLTRSDLQELLEKTDASFTITGNFEENVPGGDWKFRFGEFRSEQESQLVDYEYRLLVSGLQEEAQGTILNGVPDGLWTYSIDSILRSEVAKNLFKSTIEYNEGLPQKSFRIERADNTLVGRSLRNGLAHDQWSLFTNEGVGALESWYFDNGTLLRIETTTENNSTVLDVYPMALTEGQTMNIDDNYIRILRIKAGSEASGKDISDGLYELIAENTTHYKKLDDILSGFDQVEIGVNFKVYVESHPLIDHEISILDTIRIVGGRASTVSKALLANTQLNIVRLTDSGAADLYERVYKLEESIVKPIDKLLEFDESKILEAVSREELLNYLWPRSGIGAGFQQRIIDNGIDYPPKSLRAVFELAANASKSLDSIQQALGTKLNIDQRQRDLIQIEDQLIAQSKKISLLVDSLQAITSGNVRQALLNMKSKTEDDLSSYSGLQNEKAKLDYGRQLLVCQQRLLELVHATGALPAQAGEIEQLYKDDIWNPHMAVIMVDDVKKRITAAYGKVVIPDLLNRLIADLNCDNAANYVSLMKSLYQRMLEMREEDTSKMERKLKREDDPVEILRMFNVEPNYTD